MAGWDADSPGLRRNLAKVLESARGSAAGRVAPKFEMARAWHGQAMSGLSVPDPAYVGRFRGEPGLVGCEVQIGNLPGVASADVHVQLLAFEAKLHRVMAELDAQYPTGDDLDEDGLGAVIDVASWAHSEWVRIHPFANGNGRTARIWANFILMRYGIPPVIRLRPRPAAADYGSASAAAMKGDWGPTVAVFRAMVRDGCAL